MSAVRRLVENWRSSDVLLEPPASSDEIKSLEQSLGAPLPEDVATRYRLANGMPDLEYDSHEMSFWSIPKILNENERRDGNDPNGPFRDLAAADFLINSWFLYLRVRGSTVTLFLEGSGEEFPSLEALAARYVEAPNSLPIL